MELMEKLEHAGGFAVDEAQLLDEADALLRGLEPTAFIYLSNDAPLGSGEQSLGADSSDDTVAIPVKREPAGEMKALVVAEPARPKKGRRPKPGAMRNHSRDRLQRELASLRSHVVGLEKDLLMLRTSKSTIRQLVLPKVWEEIAKSQASKLHAAKADNKRLKAMVATQKTQVVEMENRIINWQHATTVLIQSSSISMFQPKTVHLDPGDEVLLEMFISELDATYAQLESAFRDAGMDQLGPECFSSVMPKTTVSSDGVLQRSYFELVDVDTSPFDFRLTSRVAWHCFGQQSRSSDVVHYKSIAGGDDVIAMKQRVKRVYNGVVVYCHSLTVLKQIELPDRSVDVWRGMFKGVDCFEGSIVQETGWLVSSALPPIGDDDSAVGSVVKSLAILEPKRDHDENGVSATHAETDVMTNLVVEAYDDDIAEVGEMMENMLLEHTVATKGELSHESSYEHKFGNNSNKIAYSSN
uniref:M96 mating-specific protein family n=1 Tax=Globisporangium ultimum (strain ATCC 200006 / CBS 805.95 / DAOM BR144) TaxID=431595 RepID=K3W9I1_GLOUD